MARTLVEEIEHLLKLSRQYHYEYVRTYDLEAKGKSEAFKEAAQDVARNLGQ